MFRSFSRIPAEELEDLAKSQDAMRLRRVLWEDLGCKTEHMIQDLASRGHFKQAKRAGILLAQAYELGEIAYRSGVLRTRIEERGLGEYEKEIMMGYNVSSTQAQFDTPSPGTLEGEFEFVRAQSTSYLAFGEQYIARWQMYNNLFGERRRKV